MESNLLIRVFWGASRALQYRVWVKLLPILFNLICLPKVVFTFLAFHFPSLADQLFLWAIIFHLSFITRSFLAYLLFFRKTWLLFQCSKYCLQMLQPDLSQLLVIKFFILVQGFLKCLSIVYYQFKICLNRPLKAFLL